MQTQLQDAESDGRTASRHARQQIRALQSQVSAIQTQMRQGQRAWLSFEDVGVTKDINGRMVFSFSLRNSGKSPALNAHANYSVKNVISGDQLTFTYTGKNNERETARASIAPTATRYVKVYEGPISPEEINRIITRQKTVYFYGKATYDDIFSRHHWVTFCTYLELSGTDLVLNYCSEHNETDQEIENQ